MKHFSTSFLILVLTLTFISCKKNEPEIEDHEPPTTPVNPFENLVKIGETNLPGASARAVVYGSKNPETGYNVIYVAAFDSASGSALHHGHMYLATKMNMGSMLHSSPAESCPDTLAINGLFKCGAVFTMSGSWNVDLSFHNHKNNKSGLGSVVLTVVDSSPAKVKTTFLPLADSSTVIISLVEPLKPVTGINTFEVVLHKQKNVMEFSAVEDYSIEIVPTMPSMGHGSPNNVHPVHTGRGHYTGKVNFTMSGLWRINLKLFKNGVLLRNDQYFEVSF